MSKDIMALQASGSIEGGGVWPPDLDQPLPRRTQLRPRVRRLLWRVIGSIIIILPVVVFMGILTAHHTLLLLKQGVVVQGRVRALTEDTASHAHIYKVDYDFANSISFYFIKTIQSGQANVSRTQFRSLSLGSNVNVVFLPSRPDISTLEMVIIEESRAPLRPMKFALSLLSLFVAVGGSIFYWLYRYEQQFLRWGCPVAARIVDMQFVSSRVGNHYAPCFEFLDGSGITHRRTARYADKISQSAASLKTPSGTIGDAVIAIYDPVRPTRAELYPMRILMLAPQLPTAEESFNLEIGHASKG